MATTGSRSPAAATVPILAGLTLVALALRLPSFGDSLWGDEVTTNYVVNGFGLGSVFDIVNTPQEGSPPLFWMLTWLTKGLGDVEGLRAVSLLTGLACVPLTFLLGERTVGRQAAIAGAALMALSPFQIFYATEARGYALLLFLTLLATLTLLIAVETGRARWWVAYGLATTAAMYTHYTAIFVLAALFVWAFVVHAEARRPLLGTTLIAALLFLPWLPEFNDDRNELAGHILEVAHPLSPRVALNDLIRWSVGHPFDPAREVPGHLAVWAIVAGAAVGGIATLLRLRGRDRGDWWPPRPELVLIVLLAVVSPAAIALHNVVAPTIFIPRNLIPSWPALALALGALVTAGRPPLRYAATVLVIGGFAIGAMKMLDADHQRPDYAGAVEFVRETGQPGAPIVDDLPYGPGPQTSLEAAAAPRGEARPEENPILPLAGGTLDYRLELARRDGGVFLIIPPPPPDQVAAQAARIAGDGRLFLAAFGDLTLEQLVAEPSLEADFVDALPPRFEAVESRTFPGFAGRSITVHAFEGSRSRAD